MFDFLSTYTFGTPDFGHSDIWHFNLALKFLLSRSLKEGYFPLWSKDIGTGFPILGEGQIGMFNLYNLLAFKFLDPILAFNLGYLTIFLTTLIGSYLFGRVIRLSRLSAVFLSVIFSLSGVFVTQVSHFNLIQAASLLPLEFFLVEKTLTSPQKRWPILLGLAVNQQVFSGFQQSTLISLTGLAIYALGRVWKEKNYRRLLPVLTGISGGIALSLPQIIPSRELVTLSFRDKGLAVDELARFPVNAKQLLSFFFPYIWGDPRSGTFPPFAKEWGIFWESTGYFGILPIFLIPIAFLHKKLRSKRNLFVIIVTLSLILLLGKYTPFFFVFQIPPFSYFRVPARFLLLFVWGLVILAAIGLEKISSKKIRFALLLIATADLLNFAAFYNPIIDKRFFWQLPQTAKVLKKDSNWYRIYSVNPYGKWNKIFLTRGWLDINEYQPFTNALDPNQNLYWGINSSDFYAGTTSKRMGLWKSIIDEGVKINETANSFSVSSKSARLLALSGVKYLISPYLPDSTKFTPIATIEANPNFYVLSTQEHFPHAYLTQNYLVAKSVPDLYQKLVSGKDPVLETEINLSPTDNFQGSATVIKDTDLEMKITTKTNTQSLLIISDSYYPGWHAYLDGQETKILPANLNQRAVVVPAGEHDIQFRYEPYSSLSPASVLWIISSRF